MNLSGLIYATIVVLWAAVLVPMWLRRHDDVTESRSVDRFQGAMRTLSRRAPWKRSTERDSVTSSCLRSHIGTSTAAHSCLLYTSPSPRD